MFSFAAAGRKKFVLICIAALLVAVMYAAVSASQSRATQSGLFERSLTEHKDLRNIPGFNEAMCETLDSAGPDNTCKNVMGVLKASANKVAIVFPNPEKGFTFQINCWLATDTADGKRKCQEGVLMTIFEDDSITVLHFHNSDLDYVAGVTKRFVVNHPMVGVFYAGKGKYSEQLNMPTLAMSMIDGFDEEYASGMHHAVLDVARSDGSAEILTVPRPVFASFVAE